MVERTLANASRRWSKAGEKKSPTDRECLAMLWVVDKFTSYLQARPFTLATDCSALTWLFKSQALSAKYPRWALRLMEHDMELQWRPGTKDQSADALSRSHGHKTRGATVDDSCSGDSTTKKNCRGPQGIVLYGVRLGQLGIESINNNDALHPSRYMRQSPSHPTCRPQTRTQPNTDPGPIHWISHRHSQKL